MLRDFKIPVSTQVPAPAVTQQRCNGAQALCGRRFNEVVFPATHNSMSNAEEGWHFPNQEFGITRQLQDGIRGLYLDIHYENNQVFLCHTYCNIGKEPLSGGLVKIKTFMDANPNEVIAIVFESYVSVADAAAVFKETGLDVYAFTQPEGKEWPNLREMIDSGKRLVIFSSGAGDTGYPWFHYEWDYTWSSPYSFQNVSEFNCDVDRGSEDNAVFEAPHFITDPAANRDRASEANANPLFINRMRDCMKESGRLPNFVSVDFYNLGNLFYVVKSLNGL